MGIFITIWTLRGYIAALAMIILGIRFQSSKFITFLFGVYYWIIIGLNTVSADYEAYREMYEYCFAPRYASHEIGYMAISKFFYTLGFSYETFRMIIGLAIVVILISGILKFTSRPNYVLSLIIIFPLVSLVSGLRNSLSVAIIIHGSYYLLNGVNIKKHKHLIRFKLGQNYLFNNKSEETKKTMFFIFHVVVATLFHYSSLFYLVFLYAKYSKRKSISLIIQTFVFIILAVFISRSGMLYSLISRYTLREKTLQWFNSSSSGNMSVSVLYYLCFALFGIALYLLYLCRLTAKDRALNHVGDMNIINDDNILVITRIVIVSFLAFAGAIFSSVVFLRLVLTPIPLIYCVFSESLVSYQMDNSHTSNRIRGIRLSIYPFLIIVTMFVFGYWIGGDMLSTFINNRIFG